MCENAKILCPYCLTREIDPAQAICSACYSKEDKWERGSWDDLRKRKNADEIQMFTIAKKVDEAFQIPENEAYACIEKHEMIQAEALEREMEAFHRRRILCMVEIFSKIDCGILFSGYVELDTYFKNVWDYEPTFEFVIQPATNEEATINADMNFSFEITSSAY